MKFKNTALITALSRESALCTKSAWSAGIEWSVLSTEPLAGEHVLALSFERCDETASQPASEVAIDDWWDVVPQAPNHYPLVLASRCTARVTHVGIFRRAQKPKQPATMSSYAEAESNPELIAAEAEVNALPSETIPINPVEEERLDPY